MSQENSFMRQLTSGAHLVDSDHTRFKLWAPDAQKVEVILGENEAYLMPPVGDGWVELTLPCGAGTRYRYRILNQQDFELTVPDPVSRWQEDSVHGNSIVVDPQAYDWKKPDWKGRPWHETILYELHLGTCGGFRGARERLSSLAAMGFTAIELMPIASFPGERNWGYDGVLLYAPHYAYGSPDDLKALVDEAHTLGLSIFLDVVYNHFGPDGNYLGHYASTFFNPDWQTPWGDSINFSQPQVRHFYNENALYWLDEFRFDGLRFDACHAIVDKGWLEEIAKMIRETFPAERHIYLMAENDNNSVHLLQNGFAAQWNDDGHHVLHRLLTNEDEGYYSDYSEQPAEKLARCLAEGFVYQGEVSCHRQNQSRGECSKHLPPTSFVLFLQNHDQIGNRPFGERLTTLVADQTLKIANALLLLCPQIPMLFMGEEFGATQPFLYFTSHGDQALIDAVRAGRRREFYSFEKFANSSFAFKIPDPNEVDTFLTSIPRSHSVDGAMASNALDWNQWVSKLLGLRHHFIIPRLPGAQALYAKAIGPSSVMAKWRMGDNTTLTIIINLGTELLELKLSEVVSMAQAEIIFDYQDTWQSLSKGALPGNSFIATLEGPL